MFILGLGRCIFPLPAWLPRRGGTRSDAGAALWPIEVLRAQGIGFRVDGLGALGLLS